MQCKGSRWYDILTPSVVYLFSCNFYKALSWKEDDAGLIGYVLALVVSKGETGS
jgi:hypothetical protein